MLSSGILVGCLVAYGVALSYLAVRDHPLLGCVWFHAAALTVSGALLIFVIRTTMAGMGIALPICLLYLGVILAASHGVYFASALSHLLSGLAREMTSEDAIQVRPTFDRADAAAARGDLEEAERLYLDAIQTYPDDPAPLLRLADLHIKQSRWPLAAERLQQAAELAGSAQAEAAIVFRLSELLARRMGRRLDARAALEGFIAKHPKSKYAQFARERLDALA